MAVPFTIQFQAINQGQVAQAYQTLSREQQRLVDALERGGLSVEKLSRSVSALSGPLKLSEAEIRANARSVFDLSKQWTTSVGTLDRVSASTLKQQAAAKALAHQIKALTLAQVLHTTAAEEGGPAAAKTIAAAEAWYIQGAKLEAQQGRLSLKMAEHSAQVEANLILTNRAIAQRQMEASGIFTGIQARKTATVAEAEYALQTQQTILKLQELALLELKEQAAIGTGNAVRQRRNQIILEHDIALQKANVAAQAAWLQELREAEALKISTASRRAKTMALGVDAQAIAAHVAQQAAAMTTASVATLEYEIQTLKLAGSQAALKVSSIERAAVVDQVALAEARGTQQGYLELANLKALQLENAKYVAQLAAEAEALTISTAARRARTMAFGVDAQAMAKHVAQQAAATTTASAATLEYEIQTLKLAAANTALTITSLERATTVDAVALAEAKATQQGYLELARLKELQLETAKQSAQLTFLAERAQHRAAVEAQLAQQIALRTGQQGLSNIQTQQAIVRELAHTLQLEQKALAITQNLILDGKLKVTEGELAVLRAKNTIEITKNVLAEEQNKLSAMKLGQAKAGSVAGINAQTGALGANSAALRGNNWFGVSFANTIEKTGAGARLSGFDIGFMTMHLGLLGIGAAAAGASLNLLANEASSIEQLRFGVEKLGITWDLQDWEGKVHALRDATGNTVVEIREVVATLTAVTGGLVHTQDELMAHAELTLDVMRRTSASAQLASRIVARTLAGNLESLRERFPGLTEEVDKLRDSGASLREMGDWGMDQLRRMVGGAASEISEADRLSAGLRNSLIQIGLGIASTTYPALVALGAGLKVVGDAVKAITPMLPYLAAGFVASRIAAGALVASMYGLRPASILLGLISSKFVVITGAIVGAAAAINVFKKIFDLTTREATQYYTLAQDFQRLEEAVGATSFVLDLFLRRERAVAFATEQTTAATFQRARTTEELEAILSALRTQEIENGASLARYNEVVREADEQLRAATTSLDLMNSEWTRSQAEARSATDQNEAYRAQLERLTTGTGITADEIIRFSGELTINRETAEALSEAVSALNLDTAHLARNLPELVSIYQQLNRAMNLNVDSVRAQSAVFAEMMTPAADTLEDFNNAVRDLDDQRALQTLERQMESLRVQATRLAALQTEAMGGDAETRNAHVEAVNQLNNEIERVTQQHADRVAQISRRARSDELRAQEDAARQAARARDRADRDAERARQRAIRDAQRHGRSMRDTARELAQDMRDHMMFMVELRADVRRQHDQEEVEAAERWASRLTWRQAVERREERVQRRERNRRRTEDRMAELLHLDQFHGAARDALKEHIREIAAIRHAASSQDLAEHEALTNRIVEAGTQAKLEEQGLLNKSREAWALWASDLSTATDTFASVGRSLGGIMEEVTGQKGLVWWIEGLAQTAYSIAAGAEGQWHKAVQHAAAAASFFFAASQANKAKPTGGGGKQQQIQRRRQTLEEAPDARLRSPSGLVFAQYNDFRGAIMPSRRVGAELMQAMNRSGRFRSGSRLDGNVVQGWRR
jgi:hypothetical protein